MEVKTGLTSQTNSTAVEPDASLIALESVQEAKAREAREKAQAELIQTVAKHLPENAQFTTDIASVSFALKLQTVLSGEKCEIPPKIIKFPGESLERVALILSSTGKFYYRVSAQRCPCKGFHFNKKCSHFKAGFPELEKIGPATQKEIEDYTAYLHSDYAAWAVKGYPPYEFAKFIELSRDAAKVQARLHELADQKKFDCKEYRELEKVEHNLAVALGF